MGRATSASLGFMLLLFAGITGCVCTRGNVVVIDRAFLSRVPQEPDNEWVDDHYCELFYLSMKCDPSAVRAVLVAASSSAYEHVECEADEMRDLVYWAHGADRSGDDETFWTELSRMPALRQARVLQYCDRLGMVDWAEDCDQYLARHDQVRVRYEELPGGA